MANVDISFDFLFGPGAEQEYLAFEKAKKLRRERPWVRDIIRVLWGASRAGISMDQLVRSLWEMRKPSGLNMPSRFRKTVQSFLNQHTAQSTQWNGRPESNLFYSPQGKGSGTWAVHQERAAAWLMARRLPAV
ncbi:MAG TPA: hypothetical protein VK430_04090 [Xanthobacteraceae bacterium]|nr:hypothetical protein [Xanthobacteraceae bacterium]